MHSCQFCLRAELQLTTRVSINLTKVSEREEMVYARGLAGATRTGLRSLTHNDVRFVQCLCFRKDDNGAAQRGPCVRLPTIEAGMKIPTPLSNQKRQSPSDRRALFLQGSPPNFTQLQLFTSSSRA
jgi:hypothetical protein